MERSEIRGMPCQVHCRSRIARPKTVAPSGLHRDGDLAEMAVGLHHLQRVRNLCERKRFVDREVELAGLDGWPQIGAHQPVDLANLLERACAEGDADIIDAFGSM